MHTGKGSDFRRPSVLESAATKAGRLIPAAWRGALRGGFRRALAALHPESLVSTLPGGERVRLIPTLPPITWNAEEYDAFRRDVRPGDVVLDVGSNLGAYTLLFAQWVGDTGRVFAFEPAPAPFDGLRRLVEANGLAARVTASRAAVSDREGDAAFAASGLDGDNRLVSEPGTGTVTVATTTIDAVCTRQGVVPRLIKIDVEGAELAALRGARRTIAAMGAEGRVYVEMHPRLWAGLGVTREQIEAELAQQRLRAERLDGDPDIWNVEGICLRLVPLDPCAS